MNFEHRVFVSTPTFLSLLFQYYGEWQDIVFHLFRVCKLFRSAAQCPSTWKYCSIGVRQILLKQGNIKSSDECDLFIHQNPFMQYIGHWIYDNRWLDWTGEPSYSLSGEPTALELGSRYVLSRYARHMTRLSGSCSSLARRNQLIDWTRWATQHLSSTLTSLRVDGLRIPSGDAQWIAEFGSHFNHLRQLSISIPSDWQFTPNCSFLSHLPQLRWLKLSPSNELHDVQDKSLPLSIYQEVSRMHHLTTLICSNDFKFNAEKLHTLLDIDDESKEHKESNEHRNKKNRQLTVRCSLSIEPEFLAAVQKVYESTNHIIEQGKYTPLNIKTYEQLDALTQISNERVIIRDLDLWLDSLAHASSCWSLVGQFHGSLNRFHTQLQDVCHGFGCTKQLHQQDIQPLVIGLNSTNKTHVVINGACLTSAAVLSAPSYWFRHCHVVFPRHEAQNHSNELRIDSFDMFQEYIVDGQAMSTYDSISIVLGFDWLQISQEDRLNEQKRHEPTEFKEQDESKPQDELEQDDIESSGSSDSVDTPEPSEFDDSVYEMLSWINKLPVVLKRLRIEMTEENMAGGTVADAVEFSDPWSCLSNVESLILNNCKLTQSDVLWFQENLKECELIDCRIYPCTAPDTDE